MITDMKQTGIPSKDAFSTQGIRPRTQLVKPTQVNNLGRAGMQSTQASQPSPLTPVSPAQQRTSQTPVPPTTLGAGGFNPVMPAMTSPAPSSADELISPTMPGPLSNGSDTGVAPRSSIAPNTSTASNHGQIARDAIAQMSDQDLVTLLREIADGTIKRPSAAGSGMTPPQL